MPDRTLTPQSTRAVSSACGPGPVSRLSLSPRAEARADAPAEGTAPLMAGAAVAAVPPSAAPRPDSAPCRALRGGGVPSSPPLLPWTAGAAAAILAPVTWGTPAGPVLAVIAAAGWALSAAGVARGASSSAQPRNPGCGSAARARPSGGPPEYAAGGLPAQDAPGAARTPAAVPGAAKRRVHPLAAAMSEDRGPDSLDAHVRRLMKDLGLMGHHVEKSLDLDTGRTNVSRKGFPDWIIVGPNGVLFRELKTEKGRVATEQREWLGALTLAGEDAGVWRPSDLLSGQIARELTAISGWGRDAA